MTRIPGTKPAEGCAAVGFQPIRQGHAAGLLTNVDDGTTNFELRAWTDQSEDWQQVRSDLYISIKAALAKENIAMH